MDIQAIMDNINELENGITNVDNVQELANLYIVRDNLLKHNTNPIEQELNDILPAYKKYCVTKRKFQLKEITEEAVLSDMKLLCQEISEFIHTLYSNTDFYKERALLLQTLEDLHFN